MKLPICETLEQSTRRLLWEDPETRLMCLALLIALPSGIPGTQEPSYWTGYVEVPEGHPLFGLDIDAEDKSIDTSSINHLPFKRPGYEEVSYAGSSRSNLGDQWEWWIGFNCHPAADLKYVMGLCSALAKQVREFKVATNASEKVTFVAPEFNSEEEFEKLADERDRDRIGQDNARRVEEEANR